MITADQLLCHAIGDYLLQSHWMANEKTQRWWPAVLHAASYGLPFVFLRPSRRALAVIVGTHLLIDHFRLARYVCWLKNQIGVRHWQPVTPSGYPAGTPDWLAVWLLIIADNTLHVAINGVVLRWLR